MSTLLSKSNWAFPRFSGRLATATLRLRTRKPSRRAIIDIDSSGLGSDSWPVSVAWRVLDSGREGHILIKPAPTWRGWEDEAEEIHGISRARLDHDGLTPAEAAQEIAVALGGLEVHSDAPALDQIWLDKIFADAARFPVPALRRYGDLFPGAARRDYQALVRQVGDQAADWKALAGIRQLAAAVMLYERG
jgi:hypothetical protein